MNAVNEIIFTVTDHLYETIEAKASDDVLALVDCQNDLLIALLVEDRKLLTHAISKAIDLLGGLE